MNNDTVFSLFHLVFFNLFFITLKIVFVFEPVLRLALFRICEGSPLRDVELFCLLKIKPVFHLANLFARTEKKAT